MPPKKNFKRKATKKPFVRKSTFGNSLMNVPRNNINLGLGFPKKIVCKHKYFQTITLNSVGGLLAVAQFRLNSLRQPSVVATHQPMYFDQLIALYDKYIVIGAKLQLKFLSIESNAVPMDVACFQNDSAATVFVAVSQAAEQSKANVQVLGSAGVSTKNLGLNFSAKRTFGGSIMANNSLVGTDSAGPTDAAIVNIVAQSSDLSSTTACICQVYIEYVAVYTELKRQNQS